MARDHDCNGIAIVRHADGAKSFWLADGAGDVAVAASLAVGNGEQSAPTRNLKIGSAQIERKADLAPLAREILLQFADVRLQFARGVFKADALAFYSQIARVRANGLLAGMASVELQRHEPRGRGSQKQRHDWGDKYNGMKEYHSIYRSLDRACTRSRSHGVRSRRDRRHSQ